LVAASHVPPAFTQSASVFAAAAPAKAGPVKASARVTAKIEIRVFMAFSPLRWTKPLYLNALYETYQLWLDWFETLKEFPPMQKPESYNLTQIMDQMKASGHPSD
jgi:hypothetical protein